MKANDKTRITAAEMTFTKTTANNSNYKRNDDTIKKIKTEPVIEKSPKI
jgi:hypothetical protein